MKIHKQSDHIIGQNKVCSPEIKNVDKDIYESPTNRYYLVFKDGEYPENEEELIDRIQIPYVKSVKIFDKKDLDKSAGEITNSDVLYYKELGFALVTLDIESIRELESLKDITYAIMPEETYEGVEASDIDLEPHVTDVDVEPEVRTFEWGITHTNVHESLMSAEGIKVAIIDTGVDFAHPEFSPDNRTIISHSFISLSAQDDHGHGTHCAGTICAMFENSNDNFFGIAPDVLLHVCKVLNKNKRGVQNDIILGITWAVENGCQVISVSISNPNPGNRRFDIKYERLISWARENGSIVVIAGGNDSFSRNRLGIKNPLGSPSDCPSAIAVTAINRNNEMYSISNAAKTELGQKVMFTAPGVDIMSTWFLNRFQPTGFMTRSGTSMAAPFVSGILALIIKENPDLTIDEILQEAINRALDLNLPEEDQGHGLIRA